MIGKVKERGRGNQSIIDEDIWYDWTSDVGCRRWSDGEWRGCVVVGWVEDKVIPHPNIHTPYHTTLVPKPAKTIS